jgi:peptidyl-prolyl cis-trans isomerase A (cyclophilin A)
MSMMNRRLVLIAAASCLLARTAWAAPVKRAVPQPPVAAPLPDVVRVALVTDLGTITLDLDVKHAPISATNFVRYVDGKRFDGILFYRAMHLAWGDQPNGLVQAGVRGDPRRVLKPIAHEPTDVTGVLHKAGTISMARYAPGTANGDFSILLSDMAGLDAQSASTDPEAKAGYAAFGHVVGGMDVVRKIWDSPISPTAGEGALKGQMLEKPVRILTARRVALSTGEATVAAPQP